MTPGPPPQVPASALSNTNMSGSKGRRRLGSGGRGASKMRAKLPPLEAYEKEIEFPAEGPGRVIVRLERLMGSDLVRLTDTKYMSTLLERLEEEERRAWTKRRLARIKTERQRFRKLAIDGLTEPGPDMQDLTNHPVFRVNRILNKMAQIDSQMTPTPAVALPPITEVDPFEFDDTGKVFCSYPGHILLQRALLRAEEEHSRSSFGSFRGSRRSSMHRTASSIRAGSQITASSGVKSSTARLSAIPSHSSRTKAEEPPTEPATVSPSANKFHTLRLSKTQVKDLEEMQKDYGVITEKDLLREYEPHRSSLVHTVFEEDGQELYKTADAVLQVYKYEQKAVDEFIRKHRNVLI